jgi:hypothetical protein
VDILEDNNHAKNKQELLDVMDKFELNSQFSGSTTKEKSQLDHIWTNVFGNECKSGVIKANWPYFTNQFMLHSNCQTHFQCVRKNH